MTDFEVISPVGALVRTFCNPADARRYVLAHKSDLPGLRIDRVETAIVRTNVYRPRAAKTA